MLSQISPHNVPSFKTWKYHNEKEISKNFVCLLCPMYVTSLIQCKNWTSLLTEFPVSAIWCRMWKYEIIDTHFATQICSLAIAIVSILLNNVCLWILCMPAFVRLFLNWDVQYWPSHNLIKRNKKSILIFSASFGQPTAWSTVCSMVCNHPRKQLCLETL